MKKLWFIIIFCIGSYHKTTATSTGQFNIECSPCLSINRIFYEHMPIISSHGIDYKFHWSIAYHIFIKQNVFFNIGGIYMPGHIKLVRDNTKDIINEKHDLHSIGIPLLFRLYTNDIKIDTSLYGKIGIIPTICLLTRPLTTCKANESSFIAIRLLDLFLFIGTGIKYDFCLNNSFTFGLGFYYDLFGIMHKHDPINGNIYMHNHFFCFDIGFLF